jgi:alpha-beta hydrolase superfamily lysophospholipase
MSASRSPTSSTFPYKGEEYRIYGWNTSGTRKRRGVIVLYHGFMAHARYPTVRYAADFLSQHNYAILAADLPGHGESPGLRGSLASADDVIAFGIAVAQHAKNQYALEALFVMGSSFGGNLALHVARHLGSSVVDGGVILMAPMLALHVSPWEQNLLRCLAYFLPTLPLIPSKASSDELQYRDAQKRKDCEQDLLVVRLSYLRPASAVTCVELATKVQAEFPLVDFPILVLVANEDYVVNNQGSFDLFEQAVTTDKTLLRYDALHGLLCEPSPLVDVIQQDILNWLIERTNKYSK